MNVFISGASGLLGGNCLQYFTQKGINAVGSHFSYATTDTVYFNTLDIQNSENFDVVNFNPDVIVHCGALTHVDYCESNIEESYTKTVQSTINLLELAKSCNAKFVFISTDYIFDGQNGPYKETDSSNPLSVYGKHKLEAEQLVAASGLPYLTLRVTNVYGDEIRNKNFIARIIEQCQNNQKLTLKLPYDQFASPTNAMDIAKAMYELLMHNKEGVYHICSSDFMNRVELALKVLQYFPGATYDLIPIDTASLNQPAARPLLGGFVKAKFAQEFPEFSFTSVDNYLQSKIRS